MPSAEMRTMATMSANTTQMKSAADTFSNFSSKDVMEGLVLEIKENLRLSAAAAAATTMKALPCSHLSRKSSRASPYRVPGGGGGGIAAKFENRRKPPQDAAEDPYELLQKLLRDGSLVNEAVRRVKLGLSPKQRYFYESDEESSPVLRFFAADN